MSLVPNRYTSILVAYFIAEVGSKTFFLRGLLDVSNYLIVKARLQEVICSWERESMANNYWVFGLTLV